MNGAIRPLNEWREKKEPTNSLDFNSLTTFISIECDTSHTKHTAHIEWWFVLEYIKEWFIYKKFYMQNS